MSIEKQQEEFPDAMGAFRQKVRRIMEAEEEFQQTAHFSSIDNAKEFLDSLTEDDMRWFDFMEEAQRATGKDPETRRELIHRLSANNVKEYQDKIEEFKQARDTFKGSRSIWYEFLANKLNVLALNLFILQTRRGKGWV